MTSTTSMSIDDICEEFLDLSEPEERFQYLVELGDSLPPFPDACRTETNRVLGCQSMVWLAASPSENTLTFQATSDAPLVRGLIAILLAIYSGKTPLEILEFPIDALFSRLKLSTFLTHSRSNGLRSMVRRIQALAGDSLKSAPTTLMHRPAVSVLPPSESQVDATPNWSNVRADFPILARTLENGRKLVYLDNAATTQRPHKVIEAIKGAYEQYFSNVHRGGHALAAETTQRYERSREIVQRFLGAERSDQIIFTSGTTASINLVARAWGDMRLGPRSRILLSEMEHHSNIVPWQQLAQRCGCTIEWIRVHDNGELDLEDLDRRLSQRVDLLAITAVSNVLGTVNPITEIVGRAHAAGATVLVDAAQAVPHQEVDVRTWNADFVAFSGHKMLGPTGIGVLYGRRELLETMPPFLGGGSMIHSVSKLGFEPAEPPFRFEAGTPNIVGAIGLGEAIEYLNTLGMEHVHSQELELTRQAQELLAKIPGVRILGPEPNRKGGILTFVVDGIHASEIALVLDNYGIAVRAGHHCAMPLHERLGISASCRASFYFYNTSQEVQQLADGILEARRFLKRGTSTF